MRISFDIPESGDGTITGDRESLLLLVEGARRDLNACSQAMGGSTEWKTKYGKLSAELTRLTAGVPRVDLFSNTPMAKANVMTPIVPGEDREALFAAGEKCMADGPPPRVCSHPDDPSPVFPMVDDPEDEPAIEDMLA